METHDKYGPYISVDQKLAVDAVEEVKIDKSLKDNIQCNPQLHTAYRSFLDSSTGYKVGHRFTYVTSFRVVPQPLLVPTIGDVREINKVVRTLKSQYVDGRFCL